MYKLTQKIEWAITANDKGAREKGASPAFFQELGSSLLGGRKTQPTQVCSVLNDSQSVDGKVIVSLKCLYPWMGSPLISWVFNLYQLAILHNKRFAKSNL